MKIQIASALLLLAALPGCVGDAALYTPDSGDPVKDAALPDSPVDVAVEAAQDAAGDAVADAQDASSDVGADAADAADAFVLTCDAGTTVCGNVCVDTTADDKNCGSCGHDCQGGGCLASLCLPVTLASNQGHPYGIAVDSTSVYWTTESGGTVAKVALGGGNPTILASGQSNPEAITIDGTNVYWANGLNVTVMKVPLGGGSATTLASAQNGLWGLAVDATSVYWTTYNNQAVKKCAIGGCSNTPTVLASGLDSYGIAVDATNAYWTNYTGSVQKCAVGGCGANPTTIVPQQAPYYFQWIAVDATNVYWTNDSGNVQKCAIGGCNGTPTVLATTAQAFGLATDGVNVYWVAGGINGKVLKCAVGGCGGNPTILAYNQNSPYFIAVDSKNVYWTNYGGGQVARVAK